MKDKKIKINKGNDKKEVKTPHHIVSYIDNLKADIAAFFDLNSEHTFRPFDVHDHFGVQDKKVKQLINEIIHELEEDGRLMHQNGGYSAGPNKEVKKGLTGRVDRVNKSFAFVIIEGREDDIYVESEMLNGAWDGDIVAVQPLTKNSRNARSGRNDSGKSRVEGRVAEIVERSSVEIVGIIEITSRYAVVQPDNKKLFDPIYIEPEEVKEAQDGDKVIVKVTQWPTRRSQAEGEIVQVLGKAGDNDVEMHAILAEFGLPYHFPEIVEAEAQRIPDKISEKEIKNRKDIREVLTFTIDPVDAKDFDDALSVRYLDEGNVEVGIHIADVSHYVLPGTELEKEAYRRATSVYLVDRTVPMLPEKLSNNLCSLRPNEDKLSFSAIFEMSPKGKVLKQWFGRTIIHSDRRFSYEEAQGVLDSGEGDHVRELNTLNTLAKILRKERFKNGAINFETTEVRFKLDEKGKPLGIYTKERHDSNKLIEEFMLLANKRVAEYVYSLSKGEDKNTMVYRVHEAPDTDRLQTFATFVAKLGYKLEVEEENKIAKSMNSMLSKVEGKPEQNLIESLAVRTMAKARYSIEDLGHFGLAFQRYSHFTSPIRRYPDVMAHRLLQHYLNGGASVPRDSYEDASKHSSERERLAAEAERASIKYKQVEYMSMMDKDREFDGIVTGVTEFGIFVEITEAASEGLIRMTDLGDDYYELDKENYRLIGQRTKKIYTFGEKVKVKVKETNLARRSMDLYLAGTIPSPVRNNNGSGDKDRRPRESRESRSSGKSGRSSTSSSRSSSSAKPKERRKRR
ncbi:ribonuclease R [Dyadobacter chenwenxiniae]|uniref:Ribonuclease R n=1 Tax=Dyadobacter chenwenxiniae TaxID=2906456 RepID=A0A9X1PTS7_9BACT|nr:ribonuclease R [Dyadobacter chenwenxiniae]MCF0065493.1 ribonuclease R [Dyadobacter chenwenxiniae]UON82099.1 ribonuclease R [Dyadobacter chenwenxiniae]